MLACEQLLPKPTRMQRSASSRAEQRQKQRWRPPSANRIVYEMSLRLWLSSRGNGSICRQR